MNPNYTPTAARDAERAMEEITRETTLQMEQDRLANLPSRKKQDEMHRVLDALESSPFRKALLHQHLEVKEIGQPVAGKVIVTLGSIAGSTLEPIQLEILTADASAFEDNNLVFEFMLSPRKVADDTVKPAQRGHGPEVDPILENPIETQEAEVSVALPEKEHVTVNVEREIVEYIPHPEEDSATAENEDVLRSIAELNKKKLE